MTAFALRRLLAAPLVTGIQALPWAILAIAAPTIFRFAMHNIVTGIVVSPYIPFVLLSAVFLGCRYAAFVALVGAAIADAVFIGPPNQFLEGPSDIVALGLFLTVSAMIIFLVHAVRNLMARRPPLGHSPHSPAGLVFSLERGEAWASWYGSGAPIRLGPQEEVAAMMEDFLAQLKLGEHLTQTYR